MKARYYLATALYCAIIFWLSSRPVGIPSIYLFSGWDKVAHAVVYGGLATIVSVGLRRSGRPARPVFDFLVPVLFATLYGASDELHQYFVPSRSCDVMDWLTDGAGALLAQIVLFTCLWRLPLFRAPERK